MATDLNTIFFWLFVLMYAALGIASFIEYKTPQAEEGENYFALIYIIFAVGLAIYKMMGH
jgi:hypothetical protein